MDEPITKANFFQMAEVFIEKLPAVERRALPVITEQSDNFAAWRQYFERHLGWTPFVLKLLLMQRIRSVTVPAKWPGWFDSSFVEAPAWQPVRERVTPRHMRETLEQLRRRHGPNWGLKGMPGSRHSRTSAEAWHAWADAPPVPERIAISDELAAILRPQQASDDRVLAEMQEAAE